MADDSPVGSPLSELSSDAFEAEEEQERIAAMPPAKRQRFGEPSRATPVSVHDDNFGYISSDTDGDVPTTPSNLRVEDDDAHEQVTVCAWEDCDAGDLRDNDKLVSHIANEHIEGRSKKYTCEWVGCVRKSIAHASGYALKSHMRSHTREKPFFCSLPECDRAFTRSDALAKHMRTVHDTEPLRPSDPIPKTTAKGTKIKLINKQSGSIADDDAQPNGTLNGEMTEWISSYPDELGFTAEEEERGPVELYRLLRRQVHLAEEEGVALKQQCKVLESIRYQEWVEKEVLLEQVIRDEITWTMHKQEVLAGRVTVPTGDTLAVAAAANQPRDLSLKRIQASVDVAEKHPDQPLLS
ncbi:hypothetical protein BJ878DRAFT_45815 [Calycina marina]|uniref:C2H2-type domain-containing protein n=1 Tax=Calycina marina TaxID=1763456 RepID=A0A9P8CJ07_9HELO|nr:hypothetical protein BJ878DRAFT_45815 [Calycina marina]